MDSLRDTNARERETRKEVSVVRSFAPRLAVDDEVVRV